MKRHVSLILAAAMLMGMLAGCGASDASSKSAEPEVSVQSASENEEKNNAPAPDAEVTEASSESLKEETGAVSAPVEIEGWTPRENATYSQGEDVSARVIDYDYNVDCDLESYRIADPGETIDLNMFFTLNQQYANLLDDYNDNPSLQAIEEITGVHMDFVMAASSEATTQLNLMLASGDYTKIIDKFLTNYAAGGDNAIEEDIIYDLTDYLEEYAPDYYEIINTTEDVRKSTTSDTGRQAAFFNFAELQAGPRMGLFIRQDWLDELGLDTPETYEEFHDVLTEFKNNFQCAMPLLMTESGILSFDLMAAGYNVAYSESSGFYQVDGTVHYSMTEDGLLEYLTMMHTWYEEGLISSDFSSIFPMAIDEYIVAGNAGIWGSMSRMQNTWEDTLRETDENAAISAIPNAVKESGDTLHINNTKSYVDKYGSSISTACTEEELIAAIKWNNFMYTDLGSLYCNYGIEDVSYSFDEDGVPHYTSLITDDPECSQLQMIFQYLSASFNSVYQTRSGELEIADKAAWDVNNDGAYDLPTWITMTAEESETYTPLFNDIDTYVSECILKFINGDMALSEWDAYVAKVTSMGIDQCIAIKQAAYDRYNER